MKNKTGFIASFTNIMRITGLWSAILFVVAANAAAFFYGLYIASTGKDKFAFADLFCVAMLMVLTLMVPANFAQHHNLIIMSPNKSEHISGSIMFLIDLCFGLSILIHMLIMALGGFYRAMLFDLIGMLLLYISGCIVCAAFTEPGLKFSMEITAKKVIFGIIDYILGIVGMGMRAVHLGKLPEKISMKMYIIIIAAMAATAVITRIVTGRVLQSKIRLMKVYKAAVKKAPKEESYV